MKRLMTLCWLIGVAVFLCTAFLALQANDNRPMLATGMMGSDRHMMREMMQRMMGDMLPPAIDPTDLPEPRSPGARLLERFCAQCHNLPGPGMHTAAEWPPVVARMNRRMQMMSGDMMGGMMMGGMMGIQAPSEAELQAIIDYLQKHAQKPLEPAQYPDLSLPAGQSFKATCAQCHALPDPKQHSAQEWPEVVVRMKKHMAAMGKDIPDTARTEEIIGFLQQHSRDSETGDIQ